MSLYDTLQLHYYTLTVMGAILYSTPSKTVYSLYNMYGEPTFAATWTLTS